MTLQQIASHTIDGDIVALHDAYVVWGLKVILALLMGVAIVLLILVDKVCFKCSKSILAI